MPNRLRPCTAACRVNEQEMARLDAATRLTGAAHRAAYVRAVLLEAVERDLRAAVQVEDVDA